MLTPEENETLEAIARVRLERREMWPAWIPNDAQRPFSESSAKFRCFNGGFGAGKTFAGSHSAWHAMRDSAGSLGLVVSPTYPELRDYTQRTFFEQLGVDAATADTHPLVASWNKSEQHLKLINGSEVLFRSADKPATLKGSNVDWFWLDEPASCAAVTWKLLQGRLRGKIGPRRGWCTGTPHGYNWVYEEFARQARVDYDLFTASTLANSDNLPRDYIDSLLESYTGLFARGNIYGEFVAFEGQIYAFSRERHLLVPDWSVPDGISFDRTADFGTNNPTAWLWVAEIAGTVYVFDELEVRRQPVATIAREVASRWPGLLHAGDYGDIAGTQRDSNLNSYVSNYAREGINIRTRSGGAVKAGIEVVSRYLADGENGAPRLMVHPRCTRLMSALETYHWPEDRDGNPVGDEPEKDGVSDHLCDALRYWFVNRHPEQFRHPNADSGGELPSSGGQRPYTRRDDNDTPSTSRRLAVG